MLLLLVLYRTMSETRKTSKKYKTRGGEAKKRGGNKWTLKYKRSINCRRPRGFSQKQYCKYGRK
jgi:hypothetical protein